jgi:hypothetical protein
MKRIILAGLLALLSAESARTEIDVEKRRAPIELFIAPLPPDAGQAARRYELCVLRGPAKEGGRDTIAALKRKFLTACSKSVTHFREMLQRTEPNPARIGELVDQLQQLVFDEVTILPPEEPVPRETVDPWVEKSMRCLRTITDEKTAFSACADKAMREIAPFSKESADVVADAVLGMCALQKSQMTTAINGDCHFGNSDPGMDTAIGQFERAVRADILGKIVRLRAEAEKRQHVPQPSQPQKTDREI